MAAGRTKRDFQGNYHEDGSKKSQNYQLLNQLAQPKNTKEIEAVIDTGLNKSKRQHKYQIDLTSTVSNFEQDETVIDKTVRRLAKKFKDDYSL